MRPPEHQGQMDMLMRAAIERVAKNAETATDREVSLACFCWLGEKLERANGNGRKNGRKALVVKVVVPAAAWTSIGLGAMALLEKLVK